MTGGGRTAMSGEGAERDLASASDAHGGMEDFGFGGHEGPDGDPVRGLFDALHDELVSSPDASTRGEHLSAMTTAVPAASGWALRFRRAKIRHALAAAGLKVALVSTAAAAGTGALAVPGDVLPPSVQRVVASSVSPLGIDLPSPDDEDELLPLEELDEELEGDELPEVESPDPGENAVRDEDDGPEDDDEDEDTGDGPDPDSEDESADDERSDDEDAVGGTGTTSRQPDEDDEPSADEPADEDDEPSADEPADEDDEPSADEDDDEPSSEG